MSVAADLSPPDKALVTNIAKKMILSMTATITIIMEQQIQNRLTRTDLPASVRRDSRTRSILTADFVYNVVFDPKIGRPSR